MARFDAFTDSERQLLSEAFNALLTIKISALVTVNDHLSTIKGARLFEGGDFSVPQLKALIDEVGADEYTFDLLCTQCDKPATGLVDGHSRCDEHRPEPDGSAGWGAYNRDTQAFQDAKKAAGVK